MVKILGLDMGTNSIGWALIDKTENKIIRTGVRIFQEGVNRDTKGAEVSKNETRRNARQARRLIFRTKIRKAKLKEILIINKMCPVDIPEYKEWFALPPYQLRKKALTEKLELAEIGRIFYQMAQRRGFLSNRKSASKEDNTLDKGKTETSTIGIIETKKSISEGKFETLGHYLATIQPLTIRLRNRYTTRQMYIDEFNLIWERQSVYYPEILNNDLNYKIGDHKDGVLFFQRPLKSQKYLLGKCTFEKNKTKCPVSALCFEEFRSWQFINSIKYNNQVLNQEQKNKVLELFNSKEKFEFRDIRKKLKLEGENFNYEDNSKIVGNYTISSLTKLFGQEVWNSKSEKEKDMIWHVFYTADRNEWLTNYAKKHWNFVDTQLDKIKNIHLKQGYANLCRKAIQNISPYLVKGFIYSDAVLFGGIRNAFGYEKWNKMPLEQKQFIEDTVIDIIANFEHKAIDQIKLFLKTEYSISESEFSKLYHHSDLNKYPGTLDKLNEPPQIKNPVITQALFELRKVVNAIIDAYGKPDEIKIELARELKSSFEERERIRYENMDNERRNDQIKARLDEYGISHSRYNIQKVILWEESKNKCPYSGNNVSFAELLNDGYYQIEHIVPYSVSLDDSMNNKTICEAKINKEKGNLTPFQFYKNDPQEWETAKQRAKTLLPYKKYQRFISEKTSAMDDFIERQLNDTRYISKEARDYLRQICPKVNITQGKVTSLLRHYWGLNDILNDPIDVGQFEDGEYLAAIGAENKLLELVKWILENNRANKEKLSKSGKLVSGFIRNGTFYFDKSRDDHRHHAVDALVIANTEVKNLQAISTINAKGAEFDKLEFPKPWNNFFNDSKESINQILVSYKKKNRVLSISRKKIKKGGNIFVGKGLAARGPLHEDTFYGQHLDSSGNTFYHVRKPLESIDSKAKVDKIVDDQIRNIIINRLIQLGVDVNKKYSVPPNTFFETDKETGIKKPLIFLPNKNGSPVPVRKVRLRITSSNIIQLTDENKWVEPGKNHHVAIYQDDNGNLYEEIITFWEAVNRINNSIELFKPFNNKGYKLVNTLEINDLFLIGFTETDSILKNEDYNKFKQYLYRVQKLSSYYYTLRSVVASKIDNQFQEVSIRSLGKSNSGWITLNPIKVKIDCLGDISKF
jgi:CRISPR-associated endonuclease Csn1